MTDNRVHKCLSKINTTLGYLPHHFMFHFSVAQEPLLPTIQIYLFRILWSMAPGCRTVSGHTLNKATEREHSLLELQPV